MSSGPTPIHFDRSDITMSDAARLARVEEKTIRNWIARDMLNIGQKIGSRWTFNFYDVLHLKVASYLVSCARMEPAVAADIAPHVGKLVSDRALQKSERNPRTGKLVEHEAGYKHWQCVLIGFNGNTVAFATTGTDPSRRDPPRYIEGDRNVNWLHRPYVSVPADSLAMELVFDLERLRDGKPLDGEQG
ncbi:MerR family transcriptional regulator [Reyranella sp.]|uniref:MerR family transcriptional regulator n=1 Tax=Reyranella sp. TaxID=1929291 RepID=UPI003784B942